MKPQFVIAVLAVLSLAGISRGIEINDPNLNFSITIPDGFVYDSWAAGAQPNFIYGFRKPGKREPISDPTIIIERLHGTIGRTRLDLQHMPPTFKGTLTTARWNGADIDGIEVMEEAAGVRIFTAKARVPLQNEAITIWVSGNLDQREQTRQLLTKLLGSLKAKLDVSTAGLATQTNAISDEKRGEAMGSGLVLGIGAIVGLIVGISKVMQRVTT